MFDDLSEYQTHSKFDDLSYMCLSSALQYLKDAVMQFLLLFFFSFLIVSLHKYPTQITFTSFLNHGLCPYLTMIPFMKYLCVQHRHIDTASYTALIYPKISLRTDTFKCCYWTVFKCMAWVTFLIHV